MRSVHDACKTLEALDVNSGTGPDLLPALILQYRAKELSAPVFKLLKRILETGEWPMCWREHWVAPIYKRHAVLQPKNYRGVHLTAQLSKFVERELLAMMMPHISRYRLAGITSSHTRRNVVQGMF